MDHSTRTKLIFSFLTDPHKGILNRYRTPDHLDKDAARAVINDMVQDVNSKIPNVDPDKFTKILNQLKVQIRTNFRGRDWPAIPVVLDNVQAALVEYSKESSASGMKPIDRQIHEFKTVGRCVPFLCSEEQTRQIHAQEGFNLWDMRAAGFPMDAGLDDAMREQDFGDLYKRKNIEAMARIWKCSTSDAEARLAGMSANRGDMEREMDAVDLPRSKR